MKPPTSAKKAPLHFKSSQRLDVGVGSARRSFPSSIWKTAMPQAYAY